MGGQTALNLCIDVDEKGIWKQYGVDIIGVDIAAIHITEDREQFRKLMQKIDVPVAPARIATSYLEGKEIAQELGFPLNRDYNGSHMEGVSVYQTTIANGLRVSSASAYISKRNSGRNLRIVLKVLRL